MIKLVVQFGNKTLYIRQKIACHFIPSFYSENSQHSTIATDSSVMVGVPGKYKGCETCRQRRVMVRPCHPLTASLRDLHFMRNALLRVLQLTVQNLSAPTNAHIAASVSAGDVNAKGTTAGRSSSRAPQKAGAGLLRIQRALYHGRNKPPSFHA